MSEPRKITASADDIERMAGDLVKQSYADLSVTSDSARPHWVSDRIAARLGWRLVNVSPDRYTGKWCLAFRPGDGVIHTYELPANIFNGEHRR